MSAKTFTPAQQQAIEARGDTLVVAGAGAGKTGTLTERCIRLLVEGKVPVSKILVVTFTEAAAAEVRKRIREQLEHIAESEPANLWLQEQIAGLDTAHICTLHSFCLALLRENFFALDLDPNLTVLPAEQAEMLFHEVFEELLNEHFASDDKFSSDLLEVVRTHFGGWEKPLREFIRKLHHYTQTRPAPEAWYARQIEELEKHGDSASTGSAGASPHQAWVGWHAEAVKDWCAWWAQYLASLPAENENAQFCADLLQKALATGDLKVVTAALARRDCWPARKKGKHSAEFLSFFDEAEFLDSLADPDALEKDWEWNAGPLLLLLQFAKQFSERYQGAKRARGSVDFHDLEQGALRLLWNDANQGPTRIAQRWQERIEAVFVDEYQDINAAQDRIITSVSRGGAGNRFLVGDIKQSIYGFRQADPSIFRGYLRAAERDKKWTAVFLSDNFRSHEGVLNYVNPLFTGLMREQVGGIAYDSNAALKFGAAERRSEMALGKGERLPVELHVLLTSKSAKEPDENDEGEEKEDLEAAEREARIVAARLRELKESGHQIYHQKEKITRPVEWRDMVVLLRAASSKVEVYAKAFAAMCVPLETKRDGFFSAQEILDLCNLLTILDNPLQDIPLVAVLRSPLVGLTAGDFAVIRINAPKAVTFWAALNQYLKKQNPTSAKVERFLAQFHQWRNPRQCFSLAQRLEMILAQTGYAEWLLSQPRGRQRYMNVQQLLRVARQFDDTRGESLYLFLRHIQELQESAGDIEPAAISEANAVRLMTVHQSKGLEFPVVAVADMGKRFNTSDQASALQLHEKYGICAMIKAPKTGQSYPSLPLWLARRDSSLSGVGEEMRVLYVALTRAENLLLLFGSANEKQPEKWSSSATFGQVFPQQLLRTRCWLDWIATHACKLWPECLSEGGDSKDVAIAVRIHRDAPRGTPVDATVAKRLPAKVQREILDRLCFEYPYQDALHEPAKTSVSAVRKRLRDVEEEAATSKRFFQLKNARKIDGRDRGVATHTFLQHVELPGEFTERALRSQAETMRANGFLKPEELALIDWAAIVAFWESEFGREIRQRADQVRRELPFTFQLRNEDLSAFAKSDLPPLPAGELIVTQGVADLVVFAVDGIWLIDFKTDSVKPGEVAAKAAEYHAQINLYALALERIYGKPVTRRGLYFLAARKLEWIEPN